MKNYNEALKSIQEVKKLIKGMSFDTACKELIGFNCDGDVFDYNYGNITGTIYNDNGKANISRSCIYDIYDNDEEPESRTESEILELIEWESRLNPRVREIIENELIEGLNSNDIESVKYHIKTVITFIEMGCHYED